MRLVREARRVHLQRRRGRVRSVEPRHGDLVRHVVGLLRRDLDELVVERDEAAREHDHGHVDRGRKSRSGPHARDVTAKVDDLGLRCDRNDRVVADGAADLVQRHVLLVLHRAREVGVHGKHHANEKIGSWRRPPL